MADRLRPLWDFDDLESSERRFRDQLDREPTASGRAEVLTQLARVEGLRGDFDSSARLLDEAEPLAGADPIANIRPARETPAESEELDDLVARVVSAAETLAELVDRIPDEVPAILKMNVSDPGRFADLAATNMNFRIADKDEVLQRLDVGQRLRFILSRLEREVAVLRGRGLRAGARAVPRIARGAETRSGERGGSGLGAVRDRADAAHARPRTGGRAAARAGGEDAAGRRGDAG